MCNLYRVKRGTAEIAALFRAQASQALNVGGDIYPGYPAPVVTAEDGARHLRSMVWGFPLLTADMKARGSKPKPVNNVADLSKPMWRGVASKPHWRCLIPLTAFAEAEGPKGSKTRTWFSLKGQDVFAWAGFWRESAEWGAVFTGLMTDCNEAIRPVHHRMPVLLHAEEHQPWLEGGLKDALAFQQRTFPDELVIMERTQEPWGG